MSNTALLNVDDEIYTRKYSINPRLLNGVEGTAYAICEVNEDPSGNNDYYLVNIYFSVGGYAALDSLIGIPFGYRGMDKDKIDIQIDTLVEDQIGDELFQTLAALYLEKEHMWEDELERRDTASHTDC